MSMADLQQLSAEVARDPASPAFLPLAQAYRRQGRAEAAKQLCIRALARDPANLAGHALLAQLYLEAGDEERAGDEWSIVLRLDPDHFEAHRGLGFYWLDRGRYAEARRHLEIAAARRPSDTAVRGALALLEEKGTALADRGAEPSAPGPAQRQPGQIVGPLLEDSACLGAFVLDRQGLILAGGVKDGGRGEVEVLAALLGGVLGEASRVLEQLEFGSCQEMVVEAPEAVLQISSFGESFLLLLMTTPSDAAAGALSRLAERAAIVGEDLLEAGA